jgi:predicted transcriptional regulator of viral defense system
MSFDLTWDKVVLHVLGDHYPHEVDLQTIYFEVDKYKKLTKEHLENTKYGEPHYKHIMRATLNELNKRGKVKRVRRGVYVLKE